ncbi:MAG TPA: hypothetical protein VFO40_12360, partial [Chthoniobacterales bacterium]|nr:hypothetical protein [Chthoniobacterales bacterium]
RSLWRRETLSIGNASLLPLAVAPHGRNIKALRRAGHEPAREKEPLFIRVFSRLFVVENLCVDSRLV